MITRLPDAKWRLINSGVERDNKLIQEAIARADAYLSPMLTGAAQADPRQFDGLARYYEPAAFVSMTKLAADKPMHELSLDDYRRGARVVLDGDHAGMLI